MLANIYGPCNNPGKLNFLNWLRNIQMPDGYPWILVGYFNLMRSLDNRNRPGGDINEMFMFNEAISALGLVELPLTGRKYTRTNKQNPPLLERLDWFFTSVDWTILYPDSSVSTLSMETSDHVPCIVSISTNIPKGELSDSKTISWNMTNFLM